MEILLTHCETLLTNHYPLFFSVIIAGLIGSATHCSIMCSPLVAAHMLRLAENNKPQQLMLYYHAGRILTYCLLGLAAHSASQWVFGKHIQPLSGIMLMFAGIIFISSALLPRKTHHCCSKKTHHLTRWLDSFLPPQLAHLGRGMLMGFMPCGMVVAVLVMVATLTSVIEVITAAALFGLATTPVLQLVGMGALSLQKCFPVIGAYSGRTLMASNGIVLCIIGLNLVSVN